MKRSSSWKNLQRTFASTPIIMTKRQKINRQKFESSKSSLDESNDFQIEDSDEENVPCVKQTPNRKTLHKTHTQIKRQKLKPLLVNTTINTSIADDSVIWSSEESLDGEPELRDVSECRLNSRPKARSKSLLFLTVQEQNQVNSSNQQTPLNNKTSIKQQKSNHKNIFNSTITSRTDQSDTIIESDSLDENDSPKKSTPYMRTEIITRQHSADIVFTQTTNSSSNPPVIESQSSQFSVKFESPNPRMQTRRMKSKKQVKGGLVERLNKVLSNNKSEYSFWMNERTTDVIEPGEKMRINRIEQSYGRVLLHCSNLGNSSIESILCVDPSFKKLTMLQLGKIIEVGVDSNGYDVGNGTHFYPNVTKILV